MPARMSIDKVLLSEREFAFKDTLIEDILKVGESDWRRALKPDAKRALGLYFLFGNADRRRQAGLEWMSPTLAYYNRYYWLLVFAKLHEEQFDSDVGLDQQCIQMLEFMPADADWSVIGEIREAADWPPERWGRGESI